MPLEVPIITFNFLEELANLVRTKSEAIKTLQTKLVDTK